MMVEMENITKWNNFMVVNYIYRFFVVGWSSLKRFKFGEPSE